jgi:hypothetical protein
MLLAIGGPKMESFMKRGLLLVLAFALSCGPVEAQEMVIATGAKSAGAGEAATPEAISRQKPRYRVLDLCSWSGKPGEANPCVTVIKVHNLSANTCRVGVEYYKSGNDSPVCTTVRAKLPKGQVWASCSREAGSPEPGCEYCSPQLLDYDFAAGYAVVYSNCAEIGVHATINIKDPQYDLDVTSMHRVSVVPLREPPATNATQGD